MSELGDHLFPLEAKRPVQAWQLWILLLFNILWAIAWAGLALAFFAYCVSWGWGL